MCFTRVLQNIVGSRYKDVTVNINLNHNKLRPLLPFKYKDSEFIRMGLFTCMCNYIKYLETNPVCVSKIFFSFYSLPRLRTVRSQPSLYRLCVLHTWYMTKSCSWHGLKFVKCHFNAKTLFLWQNTLRKLQQYKIKTKWCR